MDDLIDLSAQIGRDIAKYEKLLADAQRTQTRPVPDGFERPDTAEIIERIIADLTTLQKALARRESR